MISYPRVIHAVETPKLDDSAGGCQPQSTPTIGACEEPGTFGYHGLTRVVACMACMCTCIPCHTMSYHVIDVHTLNFKCTYIYIYIYS